MRYLRIQEDRYGNRTIEAVVIHPQKDPSVQIEDKATTEAPKATRKAFDIITTFIIPCSMGILMGWFIL